MKKKGTTRLIILILLLIFIIIQFFGPKKEDPVTDPAADYIKMEKPPAGVTALLETACYDCHSHKTQYPWYTYVAPVSWWTQDHIEHGKAHLNFSEWAMYPEDERSELRHEVAEEVEEGHMPLKSYTWMHRGARLSSDQRDMLVAWFEE